MEGLLDGQDLVLGLEVEGLLAAGEGLDENLRGGGTRPPMSGGGGWSKMGGKRLLYGTHTMTQHTTIDATGSAKEPSTT